MIPFIAHSDTNNREYLISFFTENKSGTATFEEGIFSDPLVFKCIYFLEKTSLFVIQIATTFLNFGKLRSSLPIDFFTMLNYVLIFCLRNE